MSSSAGSPPHFAVAAREAARGARFVAVLVAALAVYLRGAFAAAFVAVALVAVFFVAVARVAGALAAVAFRGARFRAGAFAGASATVSTVASRSAPRVRRRGAGVVFFAPRDVPRVVPAFVATGTCLDCGSERAVTVTRSFALGGLIVSMIQALTCPVGPSARGNYSFAIPLTRESLGSPRYEVHDLPGNDDLFDHRLPFELR